MRLGHRPIALICGLLLTGGGLARGADEPVTPIACSIWLASHAVHPSMTPHRRDCIVAVASTYIDAEENSQPPEHQLLADNVSRHHLGTLADFQPGNRDKIIADMSHQVIASIRNRHWTVEGDDAWIVYDGYLKSNPDKVGFTVAERITLNRGLIQEIVVANIVLAK